MLITIRICVYTASPLALHGTKMAQHALPPLDLPNSPLPFMRGSPSLPDARPRLRSDSLFRNGAQEVLIEHGDQCYRLRLTRQGKLLLHK